MTFITSQSIIGEVVAENYRTAGVFKRNGIDFCCNGNRSIATACDTLQIETGPVIDQLHQVVKETDNSGMNLTGWPPDLLADYIEKKHHRFVVAAIQEITPFLNKIVQVHGKRHPELAQVQQLFIESAVDLTNHMKKEETIIFPYIRAKTSEIAEGKKQALPHFGSIQKPIAMMHHEHETEGERFRTIARLTNNYTPPQDACNTYRVTLALLQAFEADLHLHIHLENNILFPKAIQLEQKVKA